jgi:hypothetical protein
MSNLYPEIVVIILGCNFGPHSSRIPANAPVLSARHLVLFEEHDKCMVSNLRERLSFFNSALLWIGKTKMPVSRNSDEFKH